MFELSGTIKEIFEEQTFGSGFNKREFVITTQDDKYPQDIKFELVKDKTALLETVSKGDTVTVSFDVRGREWKGNYYVNLNAWKLERAGAEGKKADDEDAPFDPADAMPSEPSFDDDPPF
ncbi:MAG: DUF3127 domain-containing protein [Puniceicoccaceae bacterium]